MDTGKINITLCVGTDKVEVELEPNTSAGMAMANEVIKSIVNLGDSGKPLVNGVEVSNEHILTEADVIEIVKKTNEKG